MGCATGLVRTILFIFNFLCALVGILLITFGALSISKFSYLTDSSALSSFKVAPGLLIGLGSIIFFISFFGCCGAWKNNACLLKTYAILLLILFVLQMALGIYAYVNVKDANTDIEKELSKQFKELIDHYTDSKESKETMDLIQINLQCCGGSGKGDYGSNIPKTCCKEYKNEGNTETCSPGSGYFEDGCTKVLTDTIITAEKTIGYVAMIVSAVELVGAIFAFCLSTRNNR